MQKNIPNLDIFDRLYKKIPQESLPPQVVDNIHFLNKHCKCKRLLWISIDIVDVVLSFAEKEHIVHHLKRREPQLEAMISDFKANKSIFLLFRYSFICSYQRLP